MKKILFASLAGFLSVLGATNGAYAQNSVNTEVLEPQKNATAVEKPVTSNDQLAATAISPKAVKDFTKTHKDVNGASWEKTREGFAAKFVSDGVRNIVYYGNNGQWTGSLKGYAEEKLAPEVRKIVKREYYDYTITYVQEAETIESAGKPTYIIHVEDKNSIKLLRICDGEMDVWQEYKKQS